MKAYCKNAIEQNSISHYKPQDQIDPDELKIDSNMEGIDIDENEDAV